MRVGILANSYFLNLYIPINFKKKKIWGWARAHPGHTLDPPVVTSLPSPVREAWQGDVLFVS